MEAGSKRYKPWTPNEDYILRTNYQEKTQSELAEMLGRTQRGVARRLYDLRVTKGGRGIKWTKNMERTMEICFPTTLTKSLAAFLGVSYNSVVRKAKKMGLKKEPGFIQRHQEEITRKSVAGLRKCVVESRFKPGVRSNPEGEFKPGHRESPEVKAKRIAGIKAFHARKREEQARRKRLGL